MVQVVEYVAISVAVFMKENAEAAFAVPSVAVDLQADNTHRKPFKRSFLSNPTNLIAVFGASSAATRRTSAEISHKVAMLPRRRPTGTSPLPPTNPLTARRQPLIRSPLSRLLISTRSSSSRRLSSILQKRLRVF